MNSRARNRLIGVTALILLVAVAVLVTIGFSGGSTPAKVKQIAGDAGYVGKRVQVTGAVVPGSWNQRSNPMVFSIRDEKVSSGPSLKIIYDGTAPDTFGNGTVAVVTGTVKQNNVVESNDMQTKCPSTYASLTGADTVGQMLTSGLNAKLPVLGYIKQGSLQSGAAPYRFILQSAPNGGDQVKVTFKGAVPTVPSGGKVLVFGQLETDGTFTATQVSLPQ